MTYKTRVGAVIDAVAQHRAPESAREADVYRFSAQLLRTRYRRAHDFLDGAAQRSNFMPGPACFRALFRKLLPMDW